MHTFGEKRVLLAFGTGGLKGGSSGCPLPWLTWPEAKLGQYQSLGHHCHSAPGSQSPGGGWLVWGSRNVTLHQTCLWDGEEAALPAVAAAWNLNYSQQPCLTDETEEGQLHKMQFCSWKNGLCRVLADVCEMYWGLFLLVVRSTHAETFPSCLGTKPWKINLGWEERSLARVRGPRKTKEAVKSADSILGAPNIQSFDIYEHLGLSGWIFVITKMTPETMSSSCTLNSRKKCFSSGRQSGISMGSHVKRSMRPLLSCGPGGPRKDKGALTQSENQTLPFLFHSYGKSKTAEWAQLGESPKPLFWWIFRPCVIFSRTLFLGPCTRICDFPCDKLSSTGNASWDNLCMFVLS